MPEDLRTDEEPSADNPDIVHGDIMQRLLDYQRTLREGMEPERAAEGAPSLPPDLVDYAAIEAEPAAIATAELIDVASAEAESEVGIDTGKLVEADDADETRVVEIPEAEAVPSEQIESPPGEASTAPPLSDTPVTDLEARVAHLEGSLERLGSMLSEIRSSFQDMAIAADERLARAAELVAEARSSE